VEGEGNGQFQTMIEEVKSCAPRQFLGFPWDIGVSLILLAFLLASLALLPRLRFDSTLESHLSNRSALSAVDAAESIFPPEHLTLIALPCANPFSPNSINRLTQVSSRIRGWISTNNEKWNFYSPTTVSTLEKQGGNLLSSPIVESSHDGNAAKERLEASPLLHKLFLTKDGNAWILYLGVDKIDGRLSNFLIDLRSDFPELKFAGAPWVLSRTYDTFNREFGLLLALAALVLLVIQYALYRSVPVALFLWAFSLVPTILLLGLMIALGKPMRIAYVLAPVMTLALSTSYITHLFRSWVLCGHDPGKALADRTSIILFDAGTTVFGFASMLFSPIADLVFLGWISIAGVAISLIVIMIGMPAALGLARRPPRLSKRIVEPSGPSRKSVPGLPRLLGLAAIILVLAASSLRIGIGYEARDIFPPWTKFGRDISWFETHLSGLNEAGLVIQTGRENGIVDLRFWKGLEELEGGLRRIPGVGFVYGPPDLVGEVLARYVGKAGSLDVTSEADIGESLELLSGSTGSIFSRGFVGEDWSNLLVHVTVSPDFNAIRDMPILMAKTTALASQTIPGAKLSWSGDIVRSAVVEGAFINGQISGTFVFFGMLVVGLAIAFRSLWKALAISIVPLMGFLAALGLMGILGWNLSAENAVALAVIAGTGVDSAIVVVKRGWSGEARDATVDTTILVVGAILVLVFSSFFLIVQTAIICAVGLVASTLTTIFALPAFATLNSSRRK